MDSRCTGFVQELANEKSAVPECFFPLRSGVLLDLLDSRAVGWQAENLICFMIDCSLLLFARQYLYLTRISDTIMHFVVCFASYIVVCPSHCCRQLSNVVVTASLYVSIPLGWILAVVVLPPSFGLSFFTMGLCA